MSHLAKTFRKAERDAVRDHEFRFRVVDLIDSNCRLIVKYGALVLIAWLVRGAVHDIAGTWTLADLRLSVFGNVTSDKYVGWIVLGLFGSGGVTYGLNEGRLRRKNIARMFAEKRELELLIDPGRTSSGLPASGNTRREDRI